MAAVVLVWAGVDSADLKMLPVPSAAAMGGSGRHTCPCACMYACVRKTYALGNPEYRPRCCVIMMIPGDVEDVGGTNNFWMSRDAIPSLHYDRR